MRLLKTMAASLMAVAAATAFALPAQAAAADGDRDGMPDRWERHYGLNPSSRADARLDRDGDGLINRLEFRLRGNPRDEDTDDDGQDDGDERRTRTKVDRPDSDGDRILDGDEDSDGDGVRNEDEDDASEPCAADDDDRDGDFVADEDENELRLRVGDADSDDDGLPDGAEDRDGDGRSNEDEDDHAGDACDGDRDHDGKDDEDESDRFGTITSFDAATGTLVVTIAAGGQVSAVVTADTEIEFDRESGGDDEGGTADLVAGVGVAELKLDRKTGELDKIELL